MIKIFGIFFLLVLIPDTYTSDFGIHEKTGDLIQNGIEILNRDSAFVDLAEEIDRPTILSLVYFDCKEYCPRLLSGLGELTQNLKLKSGIDYKVITIGFGPHDNIAKAKDTKNILTDHLKTEIHNDGWEFYTINEENMRLLSNNLGYSYLRNEDGHYIHAAFLVVISSNKKIVNYMYGYRYLAPDFMMTYELAMKDEIRNTVPRDIKYCTNFSAPALSKAHKIAVIYGLIIIFGALSLFLILVISNKKKHKA